MVHLIHPLRHWSDGVRGAYVVLADGRLIDVAVAPTETDRTSAPPRRGARRFALPAEPPVSLSIIPWPNSIEVNGARVTPLGLDLTTHVAAAQRAVATPSPNWLADFVSGGRVEESYRRRGRAR